MQNSSFSIQNSVISMQIATNTSLPNTSHLWHKSIVLGTKSIILSAKFIIFSAKFIIFSHRSEPRSHCQSHQAIPCGSTLAPYSRDCPAHQRQPSATCKRSSGRYRSQSRSLYTCKIHHFKYIIPRFWYTIPPFWYTIPRFEYKNHHFYSQLDEAA